MIKCLSTLFEARTQHLCQNWLICGSSSTGYILLNKNCNNLQNYVCCVFVPESCQAFMTTLWRSKTYYNRCYITNYVYGTEPTAQNQSSLFLPGNCLSWCDSNPCVQPSRHCVLPQSQHTTASGTGIQVFIGVLVSTLSKVIQIRYYATLQELHKQEIDGQLQL